DHLGAQHDVDRPRQDASRIDHEARTVSDDRAYIPVGRGRSRGLDPHLIVRREAWSLLHISSLALLLRADYGTRHHPLVDRGEELGERLLVLGPDGIEEVPRVGSILGGHAAHDRALRAEAIALSLVSQTPEEAFSYPFGHQTVTTCPPAFRSTL